MSFEELFPENRTEAMRLAVLEAKARELHAQEQLSRSPSRGRTPSPMRLAVAWAPRSVSPQRRRSLRELKAAFLELKHQAAALKLLGHESREHHGLQARCMIYNI